MYVQKIALLFLFQTSSSSFCCCCCRSYLITEWTKTFVSAPPQAVAADPSCHACADQQAVAAVATAAVDERLFHARNFFISLLLSPISAATATLFPPSLRYCYHDNGWGLNNGNVLLLNLLWAKYFYLCIFLLSFVILRQQQNRERKKSHKNICEKVFVIFPNFAKKYCLALSNTLFPIKLLYTWLHPISGHQIFYAHLISQVLQKWLGVEKRRKLFF